MIVILSYYYYYTYYYYYYYYYYDCCCMVAQLVVHCAITCLLFLKGLSAMVVTHSMDGMYSLNTGQVAS